MPHLKDDSVITEMLKRKPLLRFSVYSQAQVDIVGRLSAEILELLEKSIARETVDGQAFERIYGLFWLWVLGAYEVTRTMSEYSKCFSEPLQNEMAAFKKKISVLRIPFAKQQFQGREKRPISGEASVYGIDTTRRDLMFRVNDAEVWVRELIGQFDNFVGSITLDDVLCDLRDAKKS